MLNGLEVTQFTYFQQAGGVELNPVSLEITYGIERLALFLAKKDDIYELDWSDDISYRDLRMKEEIQFSEYNFKEADIEHLKTMFNMYESEISNLIGKNLYLPAYDLALKLSHIFNLLDARRALSITQRQERILSIRNYVKEIARIYLEEIDNG